MELIFRELPLIIALKLIFSIYLMIIFKNKMRKNYYKIVKVKFIVKVVSQKKTKKMIIMTILRKNKSVKS
jgi:hypothetical protein